MSTAVQRWLSCVKRYLTGRGSLNSARSQSSRSPWNRVRPCLEPLEDRLAPALYTVNSLGNEPAWSARRGPSINRDGPTIITLRSAIEAGDRSQDNDVVIDLSQVPRTANNHT